MQEMSNTQDKIDSVVNAGASTSAGKPSPPNAPLMWSSRYGIILAAKVENPLTQSLSTYGEWVEQELDMIGVLLEESQVALEYGADLGAHTLWLSKMAGATGLVYVVEARRMSHIAVCSTLALNDVRNVHPIHAALGDASREIELDAGTGHGKEGTRQITLDSLKLGELHLLKINQPGGLLPILAGGERTLANQLPAIYFRLTSAELATKEIDALKALGYRCWSHLPYLYNADNFRGTKTNIFPGSVGQNVIAVHMSKAADFGHLQEL